METNFRGTTVILIRHAERENTPPNPQLTVAGVARAQELIRVLGKSDIEAIYNSQFIRSKKTAEPLAAHLGISATQLDQALEIKNDILSHHDGKVVLVVGHSDTVPDLINQLSGSQMPMIDNDEFDNLFIVTILDPGRARVTALKYGAPS